MKRRDFIGNLAMTPLLRLQLASSSQEANTIQATENVRRLQEPGLRLPDADAVWHETPVQVGLRKQLLADDFILSHRSNITRELGTATKANNGKPILVADKPWEDENDYFGDYLTVLHDGNKFRMWYTAYGIEGKDPRFIIAYAESADGLHWEKPNLELFDFDPAKAQKLGLKPPPGADPNFKGRQNNLMGNVGGVSVEFCCFLDPHETDPAHRYKAGYQHAKKGAACLAHSPDGIHDWTPYNNGEPVTGRAADTFNQILWDEDAQLYRLYTRTDFGTPGGDTEFRGNRGMTNPDVKANPSNWTTVRSWKFDREGPEEVKRRQVYALTNTIYEGVHFGLIWVYEWPVAAPTLRRDVDYDKRHERDVMNLYLGTSRDGNTWDLSWVYAEKPLIPRGPDGSFDKDMIFGPSSIVTWKDRHWIYYTGLRERHCRTPGKPAIGLATLRLDGFVVLEPWVKENPAWVITRPFKLEGSKLEMNADAKQGGLAVEVLDAVGQPIPGYTYKESKPLKGADGLRLISQWEKQPDLAVLKGKVIRLKFHLMKAKLYAFQVKS